MINFIAGAFTGSILTTILLAALWIGGRDEKLPSAKPLDAQEAYYKGKNDAFDECIALVKRLNEEMK